MVAIMHSADSKGIAITLTHRFACEIVNLHKSFHYSWNALGMPDLCMKCVKHMLVVAMCFHGEPERSTLMLESLFWIKAANVHYATML